MIHRFALIIPAILTLNACQTFDGLQRDIEDFWSSSQQAFSAASSSGRGIRTVTAPEKCPEITIPDSLASMSDFTDLQELSTENKRASMTMKHIDATCQYSNDSLFVDMTFEFEATLEAAARQTADTTDQSYAFPYFVAVSDQAGELLSKEVFAASINFEHGERSKNITETILQIIPRNPKTPAHNYQITTGFQLSPEQLAYYKDKTNK